MQGESAQAVLNSLGVLDDECVASQLPEALTCDDSLVCDEELTTCRAEVGAAPVLEALSFVEGVGPGLLGCLDPAAPYALRIELSGQADEALLGLSLQLGEMDLVLLEIILVSNRSQTLLLSGEV